MGGRFALVIGNSEYEDARLSTLKAPQTDVDSLVKVLRAPTIGGFDEVIPAVNQSEANIRRFIARLFNKKMRDDLVVLYFSGHGVLDEEGRLYLAVKDTDRDSLSATAIPAGFIAAEMDRSRSHRQVLVLDCCHSGAFARGAKGEPGSSVGTGSAFKGSGYGRAVLTATDSTQYAWEGDKISGKAENSVFTKYLIHGLETGEADSDCDGIVSLDELYDYIYQKIVNEKRFQTPSKWTYGQQGDIVIANNPSPVLAVELPLLLKQAVESTFAKVREDSILELERLLQGRHKGLALAALKALTALRNDDSRRVSEAAVKALAEGGGEQGLKEEIVPTQPGALGTKELPMAPAKAPKEKIGLVRPPEQPVKKEAELLSPSGTAGPTSFQYEYHSPEELRGMKYAHVDAHGNAVAQAEIERILKENGIIIVRDHTQSEFILSYTPPSATLGKWSSINVVGHALQYKRPSTIVVLWDYMLQFKARAFDERLIARDFASAFLRAFIGANS